ATHASGRQPLPNLKGDPQAVGLAAMGAYCMFASRRRHTRYLRDWSSDVCSPNPPFRNGEVDEGAFQRFVDWQIKEGTDAVVPCRSEERRVGKECRFRWSPYHDEKRTNQSDMAGDMLEPTTITLCGQNDRTVCVTE